MIGLPEDCTLSALSRPPVRRRIARRNLGTPKRHQVAALVRIAANLRAVLAPHVALQLVDRRCLRSPHDVEGNGLVRVAAKATDLKIEVARIEGVTQRWRRLSRALEGEHALIPCFAGELVGFPARLSRALGRYSDRGAVKPVAGFAAHAREDAPGRAGQASRQSRFLFCGPSSGPGTLQRPQQDPDNLMRRVRYPWRAVIASTTTDDGDRASITTRERRVRVPNCCCGCSGAASADCIRTRLPHAKRAEAKRQTAK